MDIPEKGPWLAIFLCLPSALLGANLGTPDSWIPARWPGGPVELYQRAKSKTPPADSAARDAIATWYDPATLRLLDGSPINCLMLTWSAGAGPEAERQQQQLVKAYAAAAHARGAAVLGLVYPGADPKKFVPAALASGLDGLALDGDFPDEFLGYVTGFLSAADSRMPVIRIAATPASVAAARTAKSLQAVEGVSPSARNLSDMGIRGAPSSEPWIESNVWLVRSFRLTPEWRPVWVAYQPEGGGPMEYERSVADGAVGGGRWIVALDDRLRAKLLARDAAAEATWRGISTYLKFAEDHAEWRRLAPFGKLAMVLDTASKDPGMADELLKLVARRQVPYRLVVRSELCAAALAGFRAVLATELAPPVAAERELLQAFAGNGGAIVVGPSWGNPPKDEPFADVPLGKGRATVYKDPDPESVARDMKELLSHKDAGVAAFNVPSVITYAGGDARLLLVQLLNYSNTPSTAITIRVTGNFRSARLFTPEAAPVKLAMTASDGQIDVTIPKLSLWGGVLLESGAPKD